MALRTDRRTTARTSPASALSGFLSVAGPVAGSVAGPVALCAALALGATSPASASECTVVEVQNVRPAQGSVMLAIYTEGADFNRKPAASQRRLAGSADVLRFAICDLMGQPVAMSLVQDLNANGKMDFNPLGMPAEPWGTSGTVPAMSAPSWDSSKVVLDGRPVVIRLSQ